jgi:hypothetical protein
VRSRPMRPGGPNRVDRASCSLLSSPAMDRVHGLGTVVTASKPAGGRRVSGTNAPAFAFRFWWYDVQQVEGAV